MPLDERDLRGVLREEADRHSPDRAAMLARIERGRAPRSGGLLRPMAAATAVAAVLAAGVLGVRMANEPPPPAPGPPVTAPDRPQVGAEGRRDPHSIPSWTQQNLTLRTTATITTLDVTIRIARTEGVADTGSWSSVPDEMMVRTVTTRREQLIYRFTLRPGCTLAPGSYVFAAQFNHATGGRRSTGDRYAVTGPAALAGGFRD